MRVKGSGIAQGLANARPWAVQNLQIPDPRDGKGGQMPRSSPGAGEGGWAQLELTQHKQQRRRRLRKRY